MKKSLLLAAAAAVSAAFSTNAQSSELGTVYVVPVAADGTVTPQGTGGYRGQVSLGEIPGESGVTAQKVKIDGAGFIFVAISTDGSMSTFYGLPYWAVQPAIIGMDNPLSIAGGVKDSYAQVAPGTYDITFFRSSGYNRFSVVPSDNPDAVEYPSQVYILSSSSDYVALEGAGGVYSGTVSLPESFRISYERTYDQSEYIYGPAGAVSAVENDAEIPLALGTNTDAVFTYSPDDVLKAGVKAEVKVSIVPGSESLLVKKHTATGIEDVAADAQPQSVAQYYDISGRRYSSRPTASGLYVERRGTEARLVYMP